MEKLAYKDRYYVAGIDKLLYFNSSDLLWGHTGWVTHSTGAHNFCGIWANILLA